MATLGDVAHRAGVSISVVSRVLNKDTTVRTRPETRERVLAAARELGYRPNYAGRALRSAKTHTLALVVPDVFNSAFATLFMGVQDEAQAQDYVVLLARAEDTHVDSSTVQHLINERRVDGLLLQKEDESDVGEWLRLSSATPHATTPIVMLNSGETSAIPSVHLQDYEAGWLATRTLLDAGHQRIGMINGLAISGTAQDRHQGYLAAMTAAGYQAFEQWTTWTGYDPESGASATSVLMAQPDHPTAVVVANVNAAMGVLLRARHMGATVPEHLSVIAIHDVAAADHTWPALSTIRMPMYELGQLGARTLLARIRGEDVAVSTVTTTPPILILRESIRPRPGSSSAQG